MKRTSFLMLFLIFATFVPIVNASIPDPKWVYIDVKPGSCPNSINLKSNGVVAVAIFGSSTFDVTDIDPPTVTFADASPVKWATEYVDGDGYLDMVLHFKVQELALDENSVEAYLYGSTIGGMPFWSLSSVNIVPKNN